MGFDIGNGGRLEARVGLGESDHLRLPANARRGKADFLGAVVVQPDALDHRINLVAILQSFRQAFEHDDTEPVAETGPGAFASKGRQWPSEKDAAFLMVDGALLGKGDRDAAGQGEIALITKHAWQAMHTVTSDVEQAVLVLRAGPLRLSL